MTTENQTQEPDFQLAVQEESSPAPAEKLDLVEELSGYTAMQFMALADKVEILGYQQYAEGLRADAKAIAGGAYDETIKIADWKLLAEADKRMALASHACVSCLEGDDAMGASALRQYNQQAA